MPISPSDIDWYLSVNGGTGGERDVGAPITPGVLLNLWPKITRPERIAGGTQYRKLFAENAHATEDYVGPSYIPRGFPTAFTVHYGWGVDDADDDDAGVSGNLAGNLGADFTLEALSDGADTRDLILAGRTLAGVHTESSLTLNGTTPVSFPDDVATGYTVIADAIDASRTVTIRRVTGSVVLGTIAVNQRHTFYWMPTTVDPMTLNDIGPSNVRGFWVRRVWAANAAPVGRFNMIHRLVGS